MKYCGIDLHSNNSVVVVIDGEDRVVAQRRLPNDLSRIIEFVAPWRGELVGVVIEFDLQLVLAGRRAASGRVPGSSGQHHGDQAVRRPQAQRRRSGRPAFGASVAARHPADGNHPSEGRARGEGSGAKAHPTGARAHHAHPGDREYHGQAAGRADDQQSDQTAERRRHRSDADIGGCRLGDESQPRGHRRARHADRGSRAAAARKGQAATGLRAADQRARHRPRAVDDDPVGNRSHRSLRRRRELRLLRTLRGQRAYEQPQKKGEGNVKNGNKYLAWAFVEAANFARRYCPEAKRFYERKKARTNTIVATKALAHKLARACYHILKEGRPFDVTRCFA